ncbi:Ig-like domain-containing protein [Thalassospira sp. MA62]|nr:Ig-like domain-containing protein [Thalassospira sp. MA62]
MAETFIQSQATSVPLAAPSSPVTLSGLRDQTALASLHTGDRDTYSPMQYLLEQDGAVPATGSLAAPSGGDSGLVGAGSSSYDATPTGSGAEGTALGNDPTATASGSDFGAGSTGDANTETNGTDTGSTSGPASPSTSDSGSTASSGPAPSGTGASPAATSPSTGAASGGGGIGDDGESTPPSPDAETSETTSDTSSETSDDTNGASPDQADAPSLSVAHGSGTEDGAITLDITAALTDSTEILTITISDIPDGAVLSAGTVNPDGSVTLTPEELVGLTFTPPTDFNGAIDLTVTASSSDGTDIASVSETLSLTINSDPDAPTLSVSATSGSEDSAIALNIQAALTDLNEFLTVTISGIPDGATLSAGTVNPDGSVTLTADQLADLTITPPENFTGDITLSVTATSSDGASTASISDFVTVSVTSQADAPILHVEPASVLEDSGAIALDITVTQPDPSETLTITIDNIPDGATLSAGTVNPDGSVSLTPDQLAGLTLTPPADFSGTIALQIEAQSTDGTRIASAADVLNITIASQADAPTLTINPATGLEDGAIALDIAAAPTDASETLTITISDIPAGATLSAGTVNPDGSVTLTPDQLAGLTIAPPENFNGTIDLTVTATSSDGTDTASVSDTLSITVASEADAPTLSVNNAAGLEDGAIALDIAAALTDASETLTITISDIPAGATLSAGTVNPDGTVTLTPDQLAGLTITPPEDFNGTIDLTVTASSTDGTDIASISDTLTVTVASEADAPTLSVNDAAGLEDGAIALDIAAALTDASETLTITISDIPAGATLSAGTVNPDGSVTLTPDQLAGLSITPPENFNGTIDLTVTASSTDGSDVASISDTLTVTVASEADAPTLSVNDAAGLEDGAIALDIAAALTDASETLTITISDIPAGATLSAGTVNPDGSVTLMPDQLAGLTITPPENFNGTIDLTVTASSTDGADTASISDTLTVTVASEADAPTLSVNDAAGLEDGAIALDIAAALTDTSETLTITISDIPAGATLSAGTVNPDGSVTLTPDQLAGLTITPPEDFNGTIDLTVTASSTDGTDVASVSDTLSITVASEADAPTLTVNAASGVEDGAIALDIAAALTDASETLAITISDIPAGATLSAGTVNPDGSVTLTPDQLAGLTITPPEDFNGTIDLTVTASSTDGTDVASASDTLSITVASEADAPTLTVNAASGVEDGAIALDIAAALTDASETLTITISDIPAGATLSAGTVNPDGSVTLTHDQLAGLTITPPENFNGTIDLTVTASSTDGANTASISDTLTVTVASEADAPTLTVNDSAGVEDGAIALDIAAALTDASETLTITISDIPAGATLSAGTINPDGSVTLTPDQLAGLTITPPEDFNGTIDLTVTATSSDGTDTASVSDTLSITVASEADAPTLSVNNAAGLEDGAIALDIVAALTDASETLTITISDIPAGATLSAGTVNPDGSVTLTPDQLAGLTITPPEDFNGTIDLTVTASSTDGTDVASVSDTLSITVASEADAPTLSVNDAAGLEDGAIALDIAAALTDANETLTITISNIPAGATLSAGTVNPDGSVTLTPDQLAGLTITPPEDFNGTIDLTVTASSTDGTEIASISDTLTVTVASEADAPTLTVNDAAGVEDGAIALDIAAALTDASETLTITISDIPAGAMLSAGTVNPDGSVTLTPDQLAGLTITPPENFNGTIDLTVTATSSDGADTASISDTLTVTVASEADAPTLSVNDAAGLEDGAIALDIAAALTDASETLTITISDIPAGATLSAGSVNPDGSVTLTPDQLAGLTITPPQDFNGTIDLTVTASSTDGTDTASVSDTLSITVASEADAPTLTVNAASGVEDGAIALDIAAALTDASETLTITISDIPAGATLSAGTVNPDGSVTLTPDQLAGLTITPPEDFNGTIDLTVTASSTDGADTASISDTLTVTVASEADAPTLSVNDAAGVEDGAIALDIAAALTDASETLTITISDIPAGATLSAGTVNPDGSVTLTPDQLAGLTITPPENFNGTIDLTVTASSTDGSDVASISDTLTVTVASEADAPTLTVNAASGVEDGAIALDIAAALTDANETLTITISDIPAGATLSAGTVNPDGSVTLTQDQLAGLTITPPEDFNGTIDLTVTASSTDGTDVASVSDTLSITVASEADAPTLAVNDAAGVEDGAIALDIAAALTDASETLTITISDIPAGATLSAGTVNPDGSVTLTQDQLAGLTITPPEDFNGTIDLTVTATSSDGTDTASISDTLTVTVASEADAPTLTVNDAAGVEDGAIALDIAAALTDASETLTITISDIPAGATLSAGTVNPDGSVTLTPDQLAGLTITPPEDFNGTIDLTVTASSTDGTDVASVSDTLSITVASEADAPTLTVNAASGVEDGAIALDIAAALTDASETLTITISDIPAGATLSAGTVNPDGSVTLTHGQLAGLTITPPENFNGTIDLTVTASSTDGSDVASISDTLTVTVASEADAPTLTVNAASGLEDGAIALDIAAALTDANETLTITISDIPAGATLSAGTVNPDGSVTLTPNQLAGLTITPPEDFNGTIDLTVTASSTDGTDIASISDTLSVTVASQADAPTLSVNDAAGLEDGAIALDIAAALTDANETLTINISDIPAGATLSAGTVNPDGSVTLMPDQLAGLTITPPENFNGTIDLTVTASSTDGANTASISDTLTVTVASEADAPTLAVNAASGVEDGAIALDIAAALTDASETLTITISDIPAGATLSAGTVNPDGSVTLTPDQLAGLTITPPEDFNGTIDLTVTASSTDGTDVASVSDTLTVSVASEADAPTLSVNDAAGLEDGAIALDIAAALTDASETLTITISDIPAGATLSAGTVNPDGTVTLTPDQLAGLTITPPEDFNGTIDLTVTASSTDGTEVASVSDTLTVTVASEADAPTLTVNAASGVEDGAIALDIAAALTDANETLTITISDIPAGATLSAGTVNPDGSVTLTPDQLAGLTITPPENFNGTIDLTVTASSTDGTDVASVSDTLTVSVASEADAPLLSLTAAVGLEDTAISLNIVAGLKDSSELLTITISDIPVGATLSAGTLNTDGSVTLTADQLVGLTLTPPEDFHGNIDLTVTVTSSDGDNVASVSAQLGVTVLSLPDVPLLTVNAAVGLEDTAIALTIAAGLTDSSELLTITISDIPVGATLSAGTLNADGSVTLTPAELLGLTLTPPEDFSGNLDLTVTVSSSDGDNVASVSAQLGVTVLSVPDAPILTVSAITGLEDSAIYLNIAAALSDNTELLSVTIGNIPDGAVLSAGTVNADGSVTLDADELIGLTITPPADFYGTLDLDVSATSSDGAGSVTVSDTLSLTINNVADTISLEASLPLAVVEDVPALLVILPGLLQPTEFLQVTVIGTGPGVSLNAGTQNADGSVTLTAADLLGLTLTVADSGTYNLEIVATVTDTLTNTSVSSSTHLAVNVLHVPALPILNLDVSASADLVEGDNSALLIDFGVLGETEVLEVLVEGLPDGATLSAGTVNVDGSVSLMGEELAGLTINSPTSGLFNLNITGTITDTVSNISTTSSTLLEVEILNVADAPDVNLSFPVQVLEDTSADISIDIGTLQTYETAEIVVSGLPSGATLSAGTVNPDGSVTLADTDLAGLKIMTPEPGNYSLSVSATVSDSLTGTSATTDTSVNLQVLNVADATSLKVTKALLNYEDMNNPLNITVGDVAATEEVSINIKGFSTNTVLSAGTLEADGSYTLDLADLVGLTFNPEHITPFDLTVTATVTDTLSNTTADTSATVHIDVIATLIDLSF